MTDTPAGGTSQRYSYAYDAEGSVALLLKESGGAQASYGYTAYGDQDDRRTKGDTSKRMPISPIRSTPTASASSGWTPARARCPWAPGALTCGVPDSADRGLA